MNSISLEHAPSPNRRSRWLLRHTLYPGALAVAALAGFALVSGGLSPQAAQFGVFALVFALALLGERLLPYRHDWAEHDSGERRENRWSMVTLMGVADPLLQFLILPGALALVAVIAEPYAPLAWFPRDWPLPAALLLAALLGELGQYGMHRLAHRDGFLWRVHRFHHSPPRLNAWNGFRAHPLNIAWYQLAGPWVLMLMGAPAQVITLWLLFGTAISILQHANIDLDTRLFDRFLGTADVHRWHHDAEIAAGGANFGTVLMFWDQVFGTYRRPRAPAPAQVGVRGPVLERGYWSWLLAPWRRAESTVERTD